MMTACCDDFDTYKQGNQSIRLLSLLITFSQMRLPWESPHDSLPPRATTLENVVAYVRCTMYDVRFRNLASLRLAKLRSVSGGEGGA